jgi:hypothetical protein
MALTIDSTIKELLANPKAAAVLEKHMPGVSTNPQLSMVESMSFPDVAPMSGGQITQAMLDAIAADLKKI